MGLTAYFRSPSLQANPELADTYVGSIAARVRTSVRFHRARRAVMGRYAKLCIAYPIHSTQLCTVYAGEARPALIEPARALHSYSYCRNFKRAAGARYRRIWSSGTSDGRLVPARRIQHGLLPWNRSDRPIWTRT